jgi:hypothetical protein
MPLSAYPSGVPGGLGPAYFSGGQPTTPAAQGSGNSITQMTAAQAAAMGVDLSGNPLTSSGPSSLGWCLAVILWLASLA